MSITAETARRIEALRSQEGSELSEHSLTYTHHWGSDAYRADFAEAAGCGIIRFCLNGRRYYSVPFGPGDHAQAMGEVRLAEPGRLMIGLLTEAEAERMKPGGWLLRENGWGFDYVYRQSDLAELKGPRYQAKRNFCRRFERAGDWHYGPLVEADALRVLAEWRAAKGDDFDAEAHTEWRALLEDLKTARIGGVLYQGERPVAFSVGERLTDETLLVSYEKAIPGVTGAFQMINREFARREGAGYRWLNRASADGHPALVKAKESYHPARRLRKFMAIDPRVTGTKWSVADLQPSDVDEAVALWRQTFGDTESFARSIAEENPGLVIRDDRGLAAMGFALPRKGTRYVYGVATRPDCRGRGYASAILEVAWLSFPLESLALVPGDASLIPFYERRGFAVASRGAYVTMTRPLLPGYRVPDPMNE